MAREEPVTLIVLSLSSSSDCQTKLLFFTFREVGFSPFQTIYIDINFKYPNNGDVKLCLLLHYGSSPEQKKNNQNIHSSLSFAVWKASMSHANNILTAIILVDRNLIVNR